MRRPLRSDTARALSNLAIDLGDPGRMARARKLHRAGAVGEIGVTSGQLRTEVFGSQAEPYEVTIDLDTSRALDVSVPEPEAITTSCSCPDGLTTCKHALATILTFAEEVEADSRLLDTFVGRSTAFAAAPTSSVPVRVDDPFFDSPVAPPASFGPFETMAPSAIPTMVVEATDAWPVFEDAMATIARRLR